MFKLPDLPYNYNALEPFIDETTMHLHHDKHHQTYVDNLNKALEGHDDLLGMEISELVKNLDKVPEELRIKVRNNGGGHFNHSLFWEIMAKNDTKEPVGEVKEGIEKTYGSFDEFKKKFSEKGLGRFGSGWIWLMPDMTIVDTPNQDSPLMDGKMPILGLDVWEHAYYLKYQNRRAEYIENWWNVINWEKVEENFKK